MKKTLKEVFDLKEENNNLIDIPDSKLSEITDLIRLLYSFSISKILDESKLLSIGIIILEYDELLIINRTKQNIFFINKFLI